MNPWERYVDDTSSIVEETQIVHVLSLNNYSFKIIKI